MPERDLLDFVSELTGEEHLAIEENLGDGYVRLRTAEAQRRQAKHDIRCVEDICIEMLRNARDAQAGNIYLSVNRDGHVKTLVFIDDGLGVPEHLHGLIFEPRVTSKLDAMVMDRWGVHGRGMALYSIKENSEAACVISSGAELGASISVTVDLDQLAEKADQSTWPVLGTGEDGAVCVARGPHNIIRNIVEFALEHKSSLDVYVGTPTEIAARLYVDGLAKLSEDQRLFCDDASELPVPLRPAIARDAKELVSLCSGIGLGISERTAHRIIAGQIECCRTPLEVLIGSRKDKVRKEIDIYEDSRGLRISKDDVKVFQRSLETAFRSIADKYYLDLEDTPRVRVGKDAITVRFSISKES